MTTALAIAQLTVARSPQDYVRGGMSYCQQFAGNFWEAHFGRLTPQSYSSAKNAMLASTIVSTDWNAAPPGAYHYFDYSIYGHVGVSLGSGLMASGTGWGTNAVANLGKHVYVHRVADYAAHLKYRGWAYTNGAREAITGLTDANAPQIGANQRQVKPGADANARPEPSTNATRNGIVKAGTVVTPDGFIRSGLPGGQPSGSDVWVRIGAQYMSATVFTNAGITGLTDLGRVDPPKPVVFRTVTVKYLNETADVKTHQVEDGKLFTEPTAPEQDRFLFNGWAVDGKLFDFSKPITGDLTIEALWSAKPPPVEPEPEPGEPVDPTPEPEPDPDPSKPPVAPVVAIGGILLAILGVIGAWIAGFFQ